jgi:hypothetical protein
LFTASSALTVKLNDCRVLTDPGMPLKDRCVAALLTTLIVLELPFREAATVSVAETVCDPIVLSVAEKFPTPPESGAFAGSVAWASLLPNLTVPV